MSGTATTPSPVAARKKASLTWTERLAATARGFGRNTIAFAPLVLAIRLYEVAISAASHPLPAGAFWLVLRGLRSDVGFVLWAAAFCAIPVFAIGLARPRAANLVHRLLLIAIAAIAILLSQYFAVTFVPLGADLFGYSLSDVRQTAGASTSVGIGTFVPIIIAAILLWWATGWAEWRRPFSMRAASIVLGLVAGSVLFRALFTLGRGAYVSDAAYYFADNKAAHFFGASIHYLGGKRERAVASSTTKLTGYPLLHDAKYDDVLGPLLNSGAKRPNLVFVVVEGLGRDFVGPGARYGGFTPFIDSLTQRSLYWENFLSSSGRTFNVLPSLLASAPYGQTGFMELGAKMPSHVSLVTLLGQAGYQTDYFTGTDGHFDNIDVFMNRERVDRFIDQSKFGAGYEKQPGEQGFSWGYGDLDLMRKSLEVIGPPTNRPRLDVYLTITTHEPFIPPNTAEYDARFKQRLATLRVDTARRAEYEQNEPVFRTLLYLDDALRYLLSEYSKRSDFGRTVFFITGDHRLIPLPEQGRLDRYHVPFILYSPMVKQPRTMSSVSSHLDVAPSILAWLHDKYGMSFPDKVSWLGTGLDTATAFRNVHSFALMRTKNVLEDYLADSTFLSGGDLFRLRPGLRLDPLSDGRERSRVQAALAQFRELNAFATTGDHLYPGGAADTTSATTVAQEDSVFRTLSPADSAHGRALAVARQKAFNGDYPGARLLAERLLRDMPNDYDARVLVARTYAWEHQYDLARTLLIDVLHRAGQYADASAALVDVEIWSGHPQAALARADSGLAQAPREPELLFGRAKALEQVGRKREALTVLDTLERVQPNYEGAAAVRQRLRAGR